MTSIPPKYLLLGEVLRPHGVRGELRIKILTDYPERIKRLKLVYVGRNPEDTNVTAYAVEHMRMNQDFGLLKLKGVEDRDTADRFRQLFIMVDLENAVPLEEGEYYLYQLIGLKVLTTSGEFIGILQEVLETGANDVYVVESDKHGQILIPVIPSVVIQTDIQAGIITIQPMEGLLPP